MRPYDKFMVRYCPRLVCCRPCFQEKKHTHSTIPEINIHHEHDHDLMNHQTNNINNNNLKV